MPGHKGKGRISLSHDVTELEGTDNLHDPSGIILEAQDRAAKIFGARDTFFLVNGSTAGVHAMLGAACRPGDNVLVVMPCHISVINAAVIFDLNLTFVQPEYNAVFDTYGAITPKQLEKALEQRGHFAAVVITSPTYFGICADISALSKIAYSKGSKILVDEAHGAHLCFGDNLQIGRAHV